MKPRSLMFTFFGEYIKHYGGEVWMGSLIKMMAHFNISESSLRGAVLRMVQQDYLKVRKIGNKSYASLTEKGRRRMEDGLARVYSVRNSQWDGHWRVIIYSIPENRRELRNQIRKELGWTGFGMISNSTWASPNPLEDQVLEMAKTYDLEDHILLFKTSSILSHTNEEVIHKGWDLEEISAEYATFISNYEGKFEELKEKTWNGSLSEEDCFVMRTILVHEYRKFLFVDPALPTDLLPEGWNGLKARELFFNLHQILSVPSTKHFETIFKHAPDQEPVLNRDKAVNPFMGV
ncbi:PaaX family transcriptional regulator [Domibacillus epiphyticus]|uniref:Phenylacetic acid degradation operon negative regulatory protein PaaX n=1 Tax=Domibacillus epiphyticus TaxID=1714355 RepID=A0A1V2A8K1_9BACI|nr:PaaX family transcriptional regulator C-terminal domain-containing protein [Domibacillus epiphyticus]OMP67296.1 phenylacetic acid degradation operon negative regulatory protein PaaX [Domibacillus epiphyticus]